MKYGVKKVIAAGGIAALLVILLLTRCALEKPSAPTWDVLFQLPLFGKTYTMRDIADEVDEISIDEQNQEVVFTLEEELETFDVGDQLKVSGIEKTIDVPITGSIDDSVAIPLDGVLVQTAEIKSGGLEVEIINTGTLDAQVQFELKDMVKGGNLYTIDEYVPVGQSSGILWEDLAGYAFTPVIHAGSQGDENYIRYFAGFTSGDQVQVSVKVDTLYFSSVTGILDSMDVSLDSVETELDIPEEFESLQIQTANLKLALDINLQFPIDIDLTIEALECRNLPLPAPIVIQEHIVPGQPDTLNLGDVAPLINSHPTRILMGGHILIGDGLTPATITDDHVIRATIIIEAPLILSIAPFSSSMEVDTLELDEDLRTRIKDNLREAKLILNVENGLPVGAQVLIAFSNTIADSTIYLPGIAELQRTLQMDPAPNDGGNPARATGISSNTLEIDLTKNDLALFEDNEELYFGFEFTFSTGTANLVKFYPDDTVQMQARIEALVRADFENLD